MPAPTARGARQPRNIEKQKKKARRAAPRAKAKVSVGNTLRARVRAKKLAGKARAAKAAQPAG
jgi:predicted thioesterase